MPTLVPATLPVVVQLGQVPAARPWLAELPSLIEQVRDDFGLLLEAPLHGGSSSWVAPAELPDGTRVIVKIGWPHREMLGEPAALRLWNGRGAVRLLAHDPQRHALLLERCEPGESLAASTDPAAQRLHAGCQALRQLWVPAPPAPSGVPEIERLGPVTGQWADQVEDRMDRLAPGYDPGLVSEGVRLLRELPGSAGRDVVLHGDFNPGNVLSCGDRGWAAIDPKPMIGDPAYDPWRLLEQVDDPFAAPDPARVLRTRLALLGEELSLDPQRIVWWAIARQVWAALLAAHNGDIPAGAGIMRQVRILAGL